MYGEKQKSMRELFLSEFERFYKSHASAPAIHAVEEVLLTAENKSLPEQIQLLELVLELG
jgi:hypothetical protein